MDKKLLRDIIDRVGTDIAAEHWGDIFAKLDARRLATLFEAFAKADIQPFDALNNEEGIYILNRLAITIKYMISNVQRFSSFRVDILPPGQVTRKGDNVLQLIRYFRIFYIYVFKRPTNPTSAADYAFSLLDMHGMIEDTSWKPLYNPGE